MGQNCAVVFAFAVGVEPKGSGVLVCSRIAAGQNIENLSTGAQSLEHTFIVCAGQVRHGDVQTGKLVFWQVTVAAGLEDHIPFPSRLAADTVRAPGSLLNSSRVPAKVIMDNVPAVAVQVDPFLAHLGTDEDVG